MSPHYKNRLNYFAEQLIALAETHIVGKDEKLKPTLNAIKYQERTAKTLEAQIPEARVIALKQLEEILAFIKKHPPTTQSLDDDINSLAANLKTEYALEEGGSSDPIINCQNIVAQIKLKKAHEHWLVEFRPILLELPTAAKNCDFQVPTLTLKTNDDKTIEIQLEKTAAENCNLTTLLKQISDLASKSSKDFIQALTKLVVELDYLQASNAKLSPAQRTLLNNTKATLLQTVNSLTLEPELLEEPSKQEAKNIINNSFHFSMLARYQAFASQINDTKLSEAISEMGDQLKVIPTNHNYVGLLQQITTTRATIVKNRTIFNAKKTEQTEVFLDSLYNSMANRLLNNDPRREMLYLDKPLFGKDSSTEIKTNINQSIYAALENSTMQLRFERYIKERGNTSLYIVTDLSDGWLAEGTRSQRIATATRLLNIIKAPNGNNPSKFSDSLLYFIEQSNYKIQLSGNPIKEQVIRDKHSLLKSIIVSTQKKVFATLHGLARRYGGRYENDLAIARRLLNEQYLDRQIQRLEHYKNDRKKVYSRHYLANKFFTNDPKSRQTRITQANKIIGKLQTAIVTRQNNKNLSAVDITKIENIDTKYADIIKEIKTVVFYEIKQKNSKLSRKLSNMQEALIARLITDKNSLYHVSFTIKQLQSIQKACLNLAQATEIGNLINHLQTLNKDKLVVFADDEAETAKATAAKRKLTNQETAKPAFTTEQYEAQKLAVECEAILVDPKLKQYFETLTKQLSRLMLACQAAESDLLQCNPSANQKLISNLQGLVNKIPDHAFQSAANFTLNLAGKYAATQQAENRGAMAELAKNINEIGSVATAIAHQMTITFKQQIQLLDDQPFSTDSVRKLAKIDAKTMFESCKKSRLKIKTPK